MARQRRFRMLHRVLDDAAASGSVAMRSGEFIAHEERSVSPGLRQFFETASAMYLRTRRGQRRSPQPNGNIIGDEPWLTNMTTMIRAQYERLAAERAQVVADHEAGRLDETRIDTMGAADRIIEATQRSLRLIDHANLRRIGQQRAQAQSKYGLSKDEQDIARGMFAVTAPCRTTIGNRPTRSKRPKISDARKRANTVTIKDRCADDVDVRAQHPKPAS